MNAHQLLPPGQATDLTLTRKPVDTGTGQAGTGSPRRSGSILAGTGSALTDKEAVRIAIRQLSLEELQHEEKVISRQLAILHGLLADIRREHKYRRQARG